METPVEKVKNEKVYSIPIHWQSYTRIEVEANDLQEAVEKALSKFLSTPDEYYLEDSFEIDSILEDEYPGENYEVSKFWK